MLVLEVEYVIDGELEILYEGIYQRDEAIVLMWSVKNGTIRVHYLSYLGVFTNKMNIC